MVIPREKTPQINLPPAKPLPPFRKMFFSKFTTALTLLCMFYLFLATEGSFIKPNNVPRVGRSNEAEMPFENDQGMMGYVIKTNKNIPRMGRRNYDSENRFDIPKFYQLPAENVLYEGEDQGMGQQEQIESYYKHLQNMK